MWGSLITLIISFLIACFMVIVIESFGYLFSKITAEAVNKGIFKNDWILNFFVGLLFYGMSIFIIGNLRILYKELVIIFSVLSCLTIWIYFKRWKEVNLKFSVKIKNLPFIVGLGSISSVLFISAFRPVTEFDALWYHLPIPKFFLQVHNLDYTGEYLRYSVHPFLNFFWNILPLSLPFNTVIIGIALNLFQLLCVIFSIGYASHYLNQKIEIKWYLQILTPILLGLNSLTVYFLGSSFNDLYAFCLGLILFTLVDKQIIVQKFNRYYLIITFYILIILFLLKLFFAIFALIALFYIIFWYFESNRDSFKTKEVYISELKFITLRVVLIFVVFILPWLVRSYLFTGRLLDPIGLPGLGQDTYKFAGSGDSLNHWTVFIWQRLYQQFPAIFITTISPIFGVGLFSILNKKIRDNFFNWWSLGMSGFLSVYFISITSDFRYSSPSISILLILGTASILSLLNTDMKLSTMPGKIFLTTILISVLSLFYLNIIFGTDLYSKLYVSKNNLKNNVTIEQHLQNLSVNNVFSYYKSTKTKVPENLKSTDVIWPVNVQFTAYIENPIFGKDDIDRNLLKNKQNFDELLDVLKSKNVKFIMIKNQASWTRNVSPLNFLCKEFLVNDQDSCKISDRLTFDTNDEEHFIEWYKIN